ERAGEPIAQQHIMVRRLNMLEFEPLPLDRRIERQCRSARTMKDDQHRFARDRILDERKVAELSQWVQLFARLRKDGKSEFGAALLVGGRIRIVQVSLHQFRRFGEYQSLRMQLSPLGPSAMSHRDRLQLLAFEFPLN